MRRENDRVFGEFDDIDLLAAQFADDGLHAHAFHADTRADAIHVAIAAGHSDLRTLSRFARATANDHGTVVDFGYFLLKESFDKLCVGAGNDDTGVLAGLFHAFDNGTHAIANREVFKPRLFL